MIPESENSGTPPAENPEKPTPKKRGRGRPKFGKKARAVVAEFIRDPDQSNADIARKIGVVLNYPGKVLRNPTTQDLMRELMENDPDLSPFLSRKALLEKLKEGLDATQIQRFADKGRVKTEKTDPDFRCRGFYLNLAAEITGAKSQKVELTGAQGAPLIPDGLTKALEAMDEATLLSLIKKLSSAE
jgi:hypothetical protein